METGVIRSHAKVAFGTPHCSVCVMFLGQPVPVISTPRGYALFCEKCALGHSPSEMRVRGGKAFEIKVDRDPPARPASRSEEE